MNKAKRAGKAKGTKLSERARLSEQSSVGKDEVEQAGTRCASLKFLRDLCFRVCGFIEARCKVEVSQICPAEAYSLVRNLVFNPESTMITRHERVIST